MLAEKIKDIFDPSSLSFGTNSVIIDTGDTDSLQIEWGSINVTSSSTGGRFGYNGSATGTFPIAFKSTPRVFVDINQNAGYWNVTCSSVTASTYTITMGGTSNTTNKIYWIAIG